MFSPTKTEDKRFLITLAELIELLVKMSTTESIDLAEKLGQQYLALEEKIKTYDYDKDDQRYYEPFKIPV